MKRQKEVVRKTKETFVKVKLNLDGTGKSKISTSIPFLDHMLELFAFHGKIDLTITSHGDTHIDDHHIVEDIGITLGTAFYAAVKKKPGIARFGEVITPMDESLSYVALDISGRPYLSFKVKFQPQYKKSEFDYSLIYEFFRAFVNNAKVTLHIKMLEQGNNHHICESIFKGLGRAVNQAVRVVSTKTSSTKGIL